MNAENMPNAEFIIKECGEALGDQSLKSLYQIATGIRDIVDQRDELVEALEWLRGAINATPENDKVQAGTWISTKHPRIKQIDEILADHRKGGDV